MFEALVQRLLNSILGEYIENFSSQNLKIGLWSGQVVLKDVHLNKEIIKRSNLPFKLKYSQLGCLRMTIPWSSLTSSKIQVIVEGLQILISEINPSLWQCKNNKIIEERKKQIQNYCEAIIKDFEKNTEKSKETEDQGYLSKMVVKIIDNLQVTVKDIHIRYEDELTKEYSFGVTLQQLKIFTVNKNDEPQFIDRSKQQYSNEPLRKSLILSNLGLYWNQKSDFFPTEDPHINFIENIARKDDKQQKMNYIILMSSNAKLLQRQAGKQFIQPQINLFIEFNSLLVEITNKQLQQIVTIAQRLQKYTNQVKVQNRKKLTKQQLQENIIIFKDIFPIYYENPKELNNENLQKIDQILQKSQVSNFSNVIKEYLQKKQRQKMITQKKNKNKGWFSGPKQLTEKQQKEIENFLNENFAQEVQIIKRPEDYFHIAVNFNLKQLIIVIGNTKLDIKESIKTGFQGLKMKFEMRQHGYQLNFTMQDIYINLLRKKGIQPQIKKQFLKKLIKPTQSSIINAKQYIKLSVIGNPLNKKHIDTDIVVITQELLILFNPKIIQIATNFAAIKINSENTDAAIQKYGEIKQKTSNVVQKSLETTKKSLIDIDITLKAITVAIFWDPTQLTNKCWALQLKQTTISADQQTLKQNQIIATQPMEKYLMSLKQLSLKYFQNLDTLLKYKFTRNDQGQSIQTFLKDFNLDFSLSTFVKNSDQIPKIRVQAVFYDLNLNLNQFLYCNIQKIGNCFTQQEFNQSIIKNKMAQQKSQVMKMAKKIGIIYLKTSSVIDPWKKYIGVLSDNYIYLYFDKKDTKYQSYYFIKNSEIIYEDKPDHMSKYFYFQLKNKVNQVIFGFQRITYMQDWMQIIKSMNEKEQILQQQKINTISQINFNNDKKVIQNNPNLLTFQIISTISKINIITIVGKNNNNNNNHNNKNDNDIVIININNILLNIKLHQCKTLIRMKLKNLQITDTLYFYKCKNITNFLYTTVNQQSQSLIDINLLLMNQEHPEYSRVDNSIDLTLAGLNCNYKSQTVSSLMLFFIPKKNQSQIKVPSKIESRSGSPDEVKCSNFVDALLQCAIPEKYSIKLRMKMNEISIGLVNSKNHVLFSKMSLIGFEMMFAISNKRMQIQGGLKQLMYCDLSNYPNTIIQQQQQYINCSNMISSNEIKQQKLLQFNIEILNKSNINNKSMLINVIMNNLQISYIQQPVLRIITYLTQQMLPSLNPQQNNQIKKIQKDNNNTTTINQPQISPMNINIKLNNTCIRIEPRNNLHQYLELNVENISITNYSVLRSYILTNQPIIMVQNYSVLLTNMSIQAYYIQYNKQMKILKLTNNMDFSISADLITNINYYKNIYLDKFQPGIRIECKMSPFFICLNHNDYNFIMKCLNWNIIYDDNAQEYLFDSNNVKKQENQLKIIKQQSNIEIIDPLYFNMKLHCISLFVTQNQLPIVYLLINKMKFNFVKLTSSIMQIQLSIQNMKGSNIQHNIDKKISIQRGMFNSFGLQQQIDTAKLRNLPDIVQTFTRQSHLKELNKDVVSLSMEMDSKQSTTIIELTIEELGLAVQLRTLLILSKLAIMEEYIQPPKPKLQSHKIIIQKPQSQSKGGSMKINIHLKDLLASVSDLHKQNFFVLQGQFLVKMLTLPQMNQNQIFELGKKSKQYILTQTSSYLVEIRRFSLYFCNIGDRSNKRQIMRPIDILISMKTYYEKIQGNTNPEWQMQLKTQQLGYQITEDQIIFVTSIDGSIESLKFEASIKDMIKINAIAQDNLKVMNDYNKQAELQKQSLQKQKQKQKKNQSQAILENQIPKIEVKEINQKAIQKNMKKIQSKIKNKTKFTTKLQPLKIVIVNDCGTNFMPVIKLEQQATTILLASDVIKSHLSLPIVMSLSFFNPRSSTWQPVIQNFGMSIDYLTLFSESGVKTHMIVSSSEIHHLKELNINISTQFIASLMATLEISKEEKKKIQEIGDKTEVQVSPYIFQNMTNQLITIQRSIQGKKSEFCLSPFFKGSVRLTDNVQYVKFRIKQQLFKVSLEHYGVVQLHHQPYYVQFRVQRLNRIIRFLSERIIVNQSGHNLYCRCFLNKKLLEQKKISKNKEIPLDGVDSIQVSFNGKSYSEVYQLRKLQFNSYIHAENKKFLLTLSNIKEIAGNITLSLRSPLLIINCLPKPITIQFIINQRTLSTKDIKAQGQHQVCANENVYKMCFKIITDGFYWSRQFFMQSNRIDQECEIFMNDKDDRTTTIRYTFSKVKNTYQYILKIYCVAFIVSEIVQDIIIYGNFKRDEEKQRLERYQLLGGQQECTSKFVLVGSEIGQKIRICGKGCLIDFSQPITLGGMGLNESRIVMKTQIGDKLQSLFNMISVEISLRQMHKNWDIFTKQITIRSRSIVINNSGLQFTIKQVGSTTNFFVIKDKERKSFYFSMPKSKNNRSVILRTPNSKQSINIDISGLGSLNFMLQDKSTKQNQYYKLNIQQVKKYIFYEIVHLTEDELPYQLIVRSQNIQVNVPRFNRTLKYGESIMFINEVPSQTHSILIEVKHNQSIQSRQSYVKPDDLNFKDSLKFVLHNSMGVVFVDVLVLFNDHRKFIIIDEAKNRKADEKQFQIGKIAVKLQKITFSFIQNHMNVLRPYESFILTLQNLQFINTESNLNKCYQIKLQFLQFDQQQPFNIPNPVVITPYRLKQFTTDEKPKFIFNALIIIDRSFVENLFINRLVIDFNDLVVKVSQQFINIVLIMSQQFMQVINYEQKDYILSIKHDEWKTIDVPVEGRKIFIKSIKIAPFVMQISAYIKIDELNTGMTIFFSTIINALGVVVSNIQGSPISFDGIQLSDCVDTLAGINNKLFQHYKSILMKQFYKIFGSLNIIGNPIGLFHNISTGFKDLKQKPSQGLVQGPLEFGLGLAQGTKSLISHSVGGALKSVSNVTGTISSGLAVLTFDKQFQQMREKQRMKKPQHVLQGLQSGGKAIFYGFKEGITGLFTKPYQNTKKEGAKGFFKGIAQGAAGFVVKPVTGVIDFASKTTEGLKNTAMYFEDRPNENRMRYPRVFYTQCFIVKNYDAIDSKLSAILNKTKYDDKYKDNNFVQSFFVNESKFLLVLQSAILLLRIDDEKIDWSIPLNGLQINDIAQKKSLYIKNNKTSHFSKVEAYVMIDQERTRNEIMKLISYLRKDGKNMQESLI